MTLSWQLGAPARAREPVDIEAPVDATGLILRPSLSIGPGKDEPREPPKHTADAVIYSRPLRVGRGLGLSPAVLAGREEGPSADPGAAPDSGTAFPAPGGEPLKVAQAGDAPRPASGGEPLSPAARAAARVRQQEEEARPQFRFGFGPLRWGGSFSDSIELGRTSFAGGDGSNSSHTAAVTVSGMTYFWQPWFALVNATVGFSATQQYSDQSGASGTTFSTDSQTNGLTGGVATTFFPVSWFPIQASANLSDSRVTGDAALEPTRTWRYSISQTVSPPRSNTNYRAALNHSIISSQSEESTVTNVLGSMARQLSRTQSMEVAAEGTQSGTRSLGDKYQALILTGRHSYTPADNMSVASSADVSRVEQDPGTGTNLAALNYTLAQAGTNLSWRPDDDEIPLTVGASARYILLDSASRDAATASRQFQSLFAGVNAYYRVSPKLGVGAAANIGVTRQADGLDQNLMTATANVLYTGDVYKVLAGTYTWNAMGTADVQASDSGQNLNRLSANVSHTYQWSAPVFKVRASEVFATFTHGATFLAGTTDSPTAINMGNSGGLNTTIATGASSRMTLAANVSDSRTFAEDDQSNGQYLSFSANGDIQFSRYSSAGVYLLIQASRTTNAAGFSQGLLWSSNGTANYSHGRAFGIPRLRYTAAYVGSTQQVGTRLTGNVDAPLKQATHSLDQRLQYGIGRLSLEAGLRFDRYTDTTGVLLYARLVRAFGAF